MANIALGLPIFAGRKEVDLERFIELYKVIFILLALIQLLVVDLQLDGRKQMAFFVLV
jgi:hypothetical protein